jgi:hypothetical protein
VAAEIALHPNDDRGRGVLDELETQTEMKPEILDDGSHRYYLNATDAGVDAFDQMLDEIDPDWRDHLTNMAGERGD